MKGHWFEGFEDHEENKRTMMDNINAFPEVNPCGITEAVVRDLRTRASLGLNKYGVTLDRKDLDLKAWLIHAYEECLDQAKYLKKAIEELK